MNIELYTVEQASEIMSLSEQTIRKYIRSNELRAIKLNRSYRISREDLNDFIIKRITRGEHV